MCVQYVGHSAAPRRQDADALVQERLAEFLPCMGETHALTTARLLFVD